MKYIKCFSQDKANELNKIGFEFLYEQNGIWFFSNSQELQLPCNFSINSDLGEDGVMLCKSLNF